MISYKPNVSNSKPNCKKTHKKLNNCNKNKILSSRMLNNKYNKNKDRLQN